MTFQKIKFATDSVCDIPAELVARWDIAVVPCFVNIGDKSYADDVQELVREDYFRQILTMPQTPTTAAMPPALAQQILVPHFEGADHLIVITTPAVLSAIHNSMRLGLQSLPPERVTLIDSGQLSMGIGWQVLVGAQVAAQTGSLSATLAAIYRVRQHQGLYAALATMELLRRSGRVSWAAASLGALLQIKPVVSVTDGVVTSAARVRTFNKAVEKLIEFTRSHAPLDKLAVLHINNLEGAQALREQLAAIAPADTLITDCGPTLGTHIGPGALGVAPVSQAWKV